VVEPQCVTKQQMMGLDTIELLDLLIIYPSLDQSHLSKQGQHHRRCWCRCQVFVPWDLLVMGAQVQTGLVSSFIGHRIG
jgi:hypothetical protein